MDKNSLDLRKQQLEKLQAVFPEAVSEGKIDWEKLKLTLGEDQVIANERYVLNWASKSDAFRAIQTPTTATLKPLRKESVDFDTTQNIFIEGENLEVLKVLQKSYYGKVKMIYIDPPYNTGNDSFIYPDKFSESKEDYLKRIGDKDEAGYLTKEGFFRKNSKENGQFHSNWLSMMYPRLFLARNLLSEEGLIFVSIDDNEVHNLRMMMNEIFGEDAFVCSLIWKRRQNVDSRAKTGVSVDHEYLIVYRVGMDTRVRGQEKDLNKYSNPDGDPRGDWLSADLTGLATKEQRPNLHYDLVNPKNGDVYPCPENGWRYSRKTMASLIEDGRILWPQSKSGRPRLKRFLKDLAAEFTGLSSVLNTVHNLQGTRELKELFDGKEVIQFPKPVEYMKLIIEQGTSSDQQHIVLDFFAGSSTTAQALLELNTQDNGDRRFIMVQLPERLPTPIDLSGGTTLGTIADIGRERIRRFVARVKEKEEGKLQLADGKQSNDVGFKAFKIDLSNFKVWRTDVIDSEEDLKRQVEVFQDPVKNKSEADNMAWEILIKSGYELTTKLERIKIGEAPLYSIAENEVLVALEEINQKAIDIIVAKKPKRFICLDRLFAGNDQLKTNTALQMKDAGVEFRTI